MRRISKWETYEQVATHLLEQIASKIGLVRVEPKQPVHGQRSGTDYIIDAKGISEGDGALVLIECRRYTTSKLKQEQLGALAYRIQDSGAKGGIIVSPLGLQLGAKKIADAENIISVELNADSTPAEFTLKFLNRLHCGVSVKLDAVLTMAVEAD